MLWWYSLRKDQSFGPHRCDVCHLRMTWLWLNQLPQLLYTLEELVLKVLQEKCKPSEIGGFFSFLFCLSLAPVPPAASRTSCCLKAINILLLPPPPWWRKLFSYVTNKKGRSCEWYRSGSGHVALPLQHTAQNNLSDFSPAALILW